MMSPLVQGQIVQAEVCDPQGGNRKRRPLVIVTATSEISDQEPLVAVAVTSRFREPLQDDEVLLPWHPAGNVRTKLRKPCVAKCSWLCQIAVTDVVEQRGFVPREQLREIIARVNTLPS